MLLADRAFGSNESRRTVVDRSFGSALRTPYPYCHNTTAGWTTETDGFAHRSSLGGTATAQQSVSHLEPWVQPCARYAKAQRCVQLERINTAEALLYFGRTV